MGTNTANATYGISEVIDNCTIESLNVTESPQRETVPNQTNAIIGEVRYDTRYELRATVRGTPTITNGTITVKSGTSDTTGTTYIVDTLEDAGTYNGLRRYNISAHRYTNCNSETAAS